MQLMLGCKKIISHWYSMMPGVTYPHDNQADDNLRQNIWFQCWLFQPCYSLGWEFLSWFNMDDSILTLKAPRKF